MKTPIPHPDGRYTKDGVTYMILRSAGQTGKELRAEAEEAGFHYKSRIPPGLRKEKIKKRQRITAAKHQAEIEGFEFNGLPIRTGPLIRLALTAARLRAEADPNYVYRNWQLADDTFRDMTAPEIIAIDDAVESFLQANSNTLADLFARIDAAETEEELEAIKWPEVSP